jgi:hypothetical protein
MNRATKIALGFVLFGLQAWLFYSVWKVMQPRGERVYDCSMAEIHPDFPPEVRRKCRELRKATLL